MTQYPCDRVRREGQKDDAREWRETWTGYSAKSVSVCLDVHKLKVEALSYVYGYVVKIVVEWMVRATYVVPRDWMF